MSDLPWEDNLLERKLQSDLKDLLKTLVAFSNSVRPNHIAIILIGEKDTGEVQGVDNPDNIQKTIRETCERIFPPILWKSLIYEKEHHYCVRIEIEYDGETPHFGGPAWVRKGSVTELASEQLFQKLIELRLSKVRELSKWVDKIVTITPDISEVIKFETDDIKAPPIIMHPRWGSDSTEGTIVKVNEYYVTIKISENKNISEPIGKITISWDDSNSRLKLMIGV